jgi:uncharacterized protein
MSSPDLIDRTANHVRTVLSGDGTGHDWWHVYRVWKMAQRIGQAEGADLLVVELAALLHDIADWKAHGGDSTVGPKIARDWLDSLGLAPGISEHVCQIIANISFKGAKVEQPKLTLEGKVVQDADRLDAMGPSALPEPSPTGAPNRRPSSPTCGRRWKRPGSCRRSGRTGREIAARKCRWRQQSG